MSTAQREGSAARGPAGALSFISRERSFARRTPLRYQPAVSGIATADLPRPPEWERVELPAEPWTSRWLTGLGMGLDGVLLRAMRFVVDAALAPPPDAIPALRAAAEPYLDGDLQRNPQRFFAFLDEMAGRQPRFVVERFKRALDGGVVISRQFLSEYRRFIEREDDPVCLENERVPVEHWMHDRDRPRGTVVALHGFSMGQPLIDAFGMMASEWYRRGLDVALLTLPYHGARSPRQARFSGEMFASPDVGNLNEAVRQAVNDTRLAINWLRRETGAPVGLLGLSLGGYVSSLMAGLMEDLDFVIPIVPPVDLADLAWRFFVQAGNNGARPPLAREDHYRAYRLHSPLTFPRKVAAERLLIVAGRGDQVVPPEHPHQLWLHWGRPSIYWFSGSHIAPFRRSLMVREIARHLKRVGVL